MQQRYGVHIRRALMGRNPDASLLIKAVINSSMARKGILKLGTSSNGAQGPGGACRPGDGKDWPLAGLPKSSQAARSQFGPLGVIRPGALEGTSLTMITGVL